MAVNPLTVAEAQEILQQVEIPQNVAGLFELEAKREREWRSGGLGRWINVFEYGDNNMKAAYLRAFILLDGMLTPKQRASLKRYAHFNVTLRNGHRYRLGPERGEICRMMKFSGRWQPSIFFCVHPNYTLVPPPDATIHHMLMLAESEKEFLKLANHTVNMAYGKWLHDRGLFYDEHRKRVSFGH